MLTQTFILQVILSFIIGGVYIAGMIRLSEKFGSKIGGLLIGMPSIVLVGLVFIALTQGEKGLVQAVMVMPVTLAACSIFLVSFNLFRRFDYKVALILAIATWFIISLPIVIYGIASIIMSLVIGLFLLAFAMSYFHKQPHKKLAPIHLTSRETAIRALFAGSLVGFAVLMAELANPSWGGLFASFPVAFVSTAIIVSRKHGPGFMASLSRPMVNANFANVIFVIGIFLLVPYLGILPGMIAAYVLCLLSAAVSYRYVMAN